MKNVLFPDPDDDASIFGFGTFALNYK